MTTGVSAAPIERVSRAPVCKRCQRQIMNEIVREKERAKRI